MSHFAKVQNGIVVAVIVAEQEFIGSGAVGDPADWLQTSYNTAGGLHRGPDGEPDGGVALRKNYAGVGFTYDAERDAFIPPKPFASWVLDEQTCLWNPPLAMPLDGKPYHWDELTGGWVELTPPPGETA